jgi:hypothetical protein
LHNLIELRLRLLERRRQHSRLGNALRFGLLRERFGTGAGIAQIRQEPSQIEFISIGKNVNCRNRSVQRQIIVHHPGELLADFALQQNRACGGHRKQQQKGEGQCHDLAA